MAGTYLFGWDSVNSKWVKLICDANGKLKIDPTLILENPPTEDESKKAATSEWSYNHKVDQSAHHAKYTDLEAQTACKLNGTLYWSCAGIHFDGHYPDVADVYKTINGYIRAQADGIYMVANVNLPNGATVTGAIIYGNAAAEAELWYLQRIAFSDATLVNLATTYIGTEDRGISYAIIDNSLYSYYLRTGSLDTNDEIYGARIKYTL